MSRGKLSLITKARSSPFARVNARALRAFREHSKGISDLITTEGACSSISLLTKRSGVETERSRDGRRSASCNARGTEKFYPSTNVLRRLLPRLPASPFFAKERKLGSGISPQRIVSNRKMERLVSGDRGMEQGRPRCECTGSTMRW